MKLSRFSLPTLDLAGSRGPGVARRPIGGDVGIQMEKRER